MGGYVEVGQYIANNCQIEWFKILSENIQGQLNSRLILTRENKGDREGIPHTHPISQVIRLELFLESG